MSELVWFVFQDPEQIGPFSEAQLVESLNAKKFPDSVYIFKVGWQDWRPLKDCLSELNMHPIPVPPPPPKAKPQVQRAERITVEGRVLLHNNKEFLTALPGNISPSGVFVETDKEAFQIGELIKLTCQLSELAKPFNVQGKVIHNNANPQAKKGYGVQFLDISSEDQEALRLIIDRKIKAIAS